MLYLTKYAAVLILSIGLCAADDCKSVPQNPNYDPKLLSGTWHLYKTTDLIDAKKSCMTYNIDNKDGTLFVKEIWKSESEEKSIDTKANYVSGSEYKVDSEKFKGAYASAFHSGDNYCLWYVCLPEHPQKGFIFAVTKDKIPNEATISKIDEGFKAAGFEADQFTHNEKC